MTLGKYPLVAKYVFVYAGQDARCSCILGALGIITASGRKGSTRIAVVSVSP